LYEVVNSRCLRMCTEVKLEFCQKTWYGSFHLGFQSLDNDGCQILANYHSSPFFSDQRVLFGFAFRKAIALEVYSSYLVPHHLYLFSFDIFTLSWLLYRQAIFSLQHANNETSLHSILQNRTSCQLGISEAYECPTE